MKKFGEFLREHVKNLINFEKKRMLPLAKEELKSDQDAKVGYIYRKRTLKKLSKSINHWKLRDLCHYTGKYRGAAHSICNLKFNAHSEILVVFHNGSNYDCHFIIKESANEFKERFECLRKNIEKYKTFSAPIEKDVTKIDKDGNESVVIIYYRIY